MIAIAMFFTNIIIVFVITFSVVFCDVFGPNKKIDTAPLPFFRRKMEEVNDEIIHSSAEKTEDPSHNIVSFLMKNVKEIFQDAYDEYEKTQTLPVNIRDKNEHEQSNQDNVSDMVKATRNFIDTENSTKLVNETVNNRSSLSNSFKPNFKLKLLDKQNNETGFDLAPILPVRQEYEQNFQISTILFRPTYNEELSTEVYFQNRPTKFFCPESKFGECENISFSASNDILSTSPDVLSNQSLTIINDSTNLFPFLLRHAFEAVNTRQPNIATDSFLAVSRTETRVSRTTIWNGYDSNFATTNISKDVRPMVQFNVEIDKTKRSCIRCSNVAEDWCSAPKYKLIPSALCHLEEDLCYSMHTPFGIVDRGCFNKNHNTSTYVCGYNLCNYIDSMNLPILFTSKQEWLQNVFDLRHFKRLRTSTMKNLSCLKCEVKDTAQDNDDINKTYCKEGKIGELPTVYCKEDEICGITSIKNKGYIWRGCVRAPLYNYYITLCDSDLCNYDPIASLYDSND